MNHWKTKALALALGMGLAAAAGAQNYYGSKETSTLPGTNKAYPAPPAASTNTSPPSANSACAGLASVELSSCLRNNSSGTSTQGSAAKGAVPGSAADSMHGGDNGGTGASGGGTSGTGGNSGGGGTGASGH